MAGASVASGCRTRQRERSPDGSSVRAERTRLKARVGRGMLDRVGPGTLTLEDPSGKIDVRRRNGQGDNLYTSRGNVAAVIAAVLAELASVVKVIPFGDGSTPIAQAVESVPAEFADLS